MAALHRLRLDFVLWLVSPQNPLKPVAGMAPLADRLAEAKARARHPRILVTALEQALGTAYTAETLARLQARCPGCRFVWIMGTDNLIQVHRWRDWTRLFHRVPVAITARPTYAFKAMASKAAHRFRRNRRPDRQAGILAGMAPPAWIYLPIRLHPASATAIRSGLTAARRTADQRPRAGRPNGG